MLEKMKDEIELLSRHLEIAQVVADHQPIGIMKLSELLDLPPHRIRYSLSICWNSSGTSAHPPKVPSLHLRPFSCSLTERKSGYPYPDARGDKKEMITYPRIWVFDL